MSKTRVSAEIMDRLKEMVLLIVRNLVNNPDAVEVNIRSGAYRILVELYTDPWDIGQVVGRKGHLAGSIRSIIAAYAGKHQIVIDFDYVTDKDSSSSAAAKDKDKARPQRSTGS